MRKSSNIHLKIFQFVFIGVGIGIMTGGFFTSKNTYELLKNGIETQGKVIDFSITRGDEGNTYAPIVQFKTPSGKEYTFTSGLSSSPAGYDLNEMVNVLYPEENPNKAEIKSFMTLWFLPFLFGGMGLIFFLIGTGILIYQKARKKMIEELKKSGRKIESTYTSVDRITNIRVNGRSPYRIFSQYEENGKIYVFHSENLWFDPSDNLAPKQKIIVLVNPQNFKKYYMDISFLPEE